MRLLADACVPGQLVCTFRDRGHDVVWINEGEPSLSDSKVVDLAVAEERVLLTLDRGMGSQIRGRNDRGRAIVVVLRVALALDPKACVKIVEAAPLDAGSLLLISRDRVRRVSLG